MQVVHERCCSLESLRSRGTPAEPQVCPTALACWCSDSADQGLADGCDQIVDR